jgi:hypothetical protein
MKEVKDSTARGNYVPPAVLRLGTAAEMTAGQSQPNSDDAVNPDNAFPNPPVS